MRWRVDDRMLRFDIAFQYDLKRYRVVLVLSYFELQDYLLAYDSGWSPCLVFPLRADPLSQTLYPPEVAKRLLVL